MSAFTGVEVWRGGVNTWECDELGHLNVRFYVARAMEGLVGLASAIGLSGAFRAHANSTMVVRDQHIRFLREARVGASLDMVAGVLEISDCDARILLIMRHSHTGEIAASFQTLVTHATARDGRAFAWSAQTRHLADRLMIVAPERAAPRSLNLEPSSGRARIDEADRLRLARIGSGAVGPNDCDVFGRMRPDFFIGRVSDGIPALRASLRPDGPTASSTPAEGLGGAVLEYRVAYHGLPQPGDRFEIRSGLADVGERTLRYVHWMLDPETGRPWATAEAVAIMLNLTTRRIAPIAESDRNHLRARLTADLSL